jgi:hypothetical protein
MGKVLVLGDQNGTVFEGISPDGGIVGIPQVDSGDMFGLVAMGGEQPRECGRQLGIDEEARGLPRDKDGMIRFGGGIFQTRADILRLEIGIVLQNLGFLDPCGKKVQHVLHPDAHASDARPTAALVWVEGDPVH